MKGIITQQTYVHRPVKNFQKSPNNLVSVIFILRVATIGYETIYVTMTTIVK